MIVVSNSSPIMNLAIIGRLELLKIKFGTLIIPEGVWKEVVIDGKGKPGVHEVEKCDWIHVESATNDSLVKVLGKALDIGESETIALALEKNADFVLLDDKEARFMASHLGLKVIGVVGLLIWGRNTE